MGCNCRRKKPDRVRRRVTAQVITFPAPPKPKTEKPQTGKPEPAKTRK